MRQMSHYAWFYRWKNSVGWDAACPWSPACLPSPRLHPQVSSVGKVPCMGEDGAFRAPTSSWRREHDVLWFCKMGSGGRVSIVSVCIKDPPFLHCTLVSAPYRKSESKWKHPPRKRKGLRFSSCWNNVDATFSLIKALPRMRGCPPLLSKETKARAPFKLQSYEMDRKGRWVTQVS